VLRTNPGATIIGDVKCSSVLFDEITRLGGKPVMWKTGHSVMKDKMRELGAPLAGELSGHIFFADKYYGFDDGLYCAVRLLNALTDNATLSGLTQHLPKLFNTPEIRIDVNEEEKFALIPKIQTNLKNLKCTINNTDGLRVTTDDGWFLLRPSNTQNALVARMESSSEQGLAHLVKIVSEQVQKLGYSLPL
jgi:phosphomannomutase